MFAKLAAVLALSAVFSADAAVVRRDDDAKCQTIAELAVATPGFETLVTAVTAAGLVDTFADAEGAKLTVFAPTDEAFADVDEDVLALLLEPENKEFLVELLQYHVVKGAVTADKLKDGQKVTALNGDKLTIEIDDDGEVTINDDADVVKADIKACNGVIHVIDEVLIPPGFVEEVLGADRR